MNLWWQEICKLFKEDKKKTKLYYQEKEQNHLRFSLRRRYFNVCSLQPPAGRNRNYQQNLGYNILALKTYTPHF